MADMNGICCAQNRREEGDECSIMVDACKASLRHFVGSCGLGADTLPQINMEAHRGPYIEDSSLVRGSSPLPCEFWGVYVVLNFAVRLAVAHEEPLHTSTRNSSTLQPGTVLCGQKGLRTPCLLVVGFSFF